VAFQSVDESIGAGDRRIAFLRGQFMPLAEANVNILTQAFLFGTAVHVSLRGYCDAAAADVNMFRLRDHFERLSRNARILRSELPYSIDELCQLTLRLVRENGYRADCYVRCVAYKAGLTYGLLLSGPTDIAMFAVEQGRFNAELGRPMSVAVTGWRRVSSAAIPPRAKINGLYVNSALALSDAVAGGYDDAIFLTHDGHASEGSGMNVCVVRGDTIATPLESDDILPGFTRDTVRVIAPALGLRFIERRIDRAELYTSDAVFFCGTGVEIVAVGRVDNVPIGTDRGMAVVDRIRGAFFEQVRGGDTARAAGWLTSVYGS
jgi:branched-chain amino acid aminotransferase